MSGDLVLMNLGFLAMLIAMYVASQIQLRSLNEHQDSVYPKLHGEIGRDIVGKLIAANEKMAGSVSVFAKSIAMSQRKFEAISGEVWDRSGEVLDSLKERGLDVSDTLGTFREKSQEVLKKNPLQSLKSRVKNPFRKRKDS